MFRANGRLFIISLINRDSFSIVFLLLLLFIPLAGCSPISSIQNFSSKQKLYDDFNKNAASKNLTIVLDNDSVFAAPYGAKIYNDSLIIFEKGDNADILLPLNKVKQASYKNRWLGIPPGLLIGTGFGFVTGAVVFLTLDNGGQDSERRAENALYILPASMIGGILWGFLGGYNYVYMFNKSNISSDDGKQ